MAGTVDGSSEVDTAAASTAAAQHRPAGSPLSDVDGAENVKTMDVLSLDSIRSSLIRQEETIIFALIERSQFRTNSIVYERGGFGSLGVPVGSTAPPPKSDSSGGDDNELSFLEYMLVGTEALHCAVRRYTSPEEHAFFPERLPPQPLINLPSLQYPQDLLSSEGGASLLNYNKRLLKAYLEKVVPAITKHGDDEQHGSCILCDIAALQAMSRRVHYGKFVAESKYRSDPEEYQRLVEKGDADGVMRLLTNEKVEEQVLRRARLKAATYGTEPLLAEMPAVATSDASARVAQAAASAVVAAMGEIEEEKAREQGKIDANNKLGGVGGAAAAGKKVDPAGIESIYRDLIIPMTKDIEVAYLFLRCGKQPPPLYLP